ncbi:MAG: hypothetical protein KY469_00445 [Actinobacteria bacterium]|nr:hypothetical protein [Actinomycetota bacterium]
MARAALPVGLALAVLAVLTVFPVRGAAGALTALAAVVFVVGNFYLTGRALAWAGRISLSVLQAVALGGFFLKLVVLAIALVLLRPIEAIDGPVLAITTVVATVVVLVAEVRLVSRRSSFWWLVDPQAAKR